MILENWAKLIAFGFINVELFNYTQWEFYVLSILGGIAAGPLNRPSTKSTEHSEQ
jgi:hypothetical protein